MDSDRAAQARQRREKILARQKDRLSAITGVYSKQEEPAGGCDIGAPVASLPTSQPADAVQGNSNQQQSAPDQAAGQEQLQSLMAAMERQLQHAQALQAGSPQVNSQALEMLQRAAAAQQQQQAGGSRAQSQGGISNASSSTAADALQSLLGTAAAAASAAGEASPPADPQSQQQQQQQPAQPPLLLQLGPALARSVRQTQLLRLLAAVLLAYAVLTGWQVGLPPVAVLAVTDLAVVLAAAVVLPAKPAEAAAAAGNLQVPWRLRSLDLLSLVPGLRELMDSLKGYNAVATALSQDFAAFVVVSGLLLSTNAVPAAVSWGLRF